MRNGTRKGLAAALHSYVGCEASSTVRSLAAINVQLAFLALIV